MKVELLPHKGILIDDEMVCFGKDIDNIKINQKLDKYEDIYYLFENDKLLDRNNIWRNR